MPTLDHAQQLRQFAEEIFDFSKHMWAQEAKAKSRDQTEVTQAEFLTLEVLSKSQPLTVGDIQRQIGVLPAQMSRIIRSLEHKGDEPLICCKINPDDKRKIDVELTPAGRKAHQTHREVKLGSIREMLRGLSDPDRAELMRILRILQGNVRKEF